MVTVYTDRNMYIYVCVYKRCQVQPTYRIRRYSVALLHPAIRLDGKADRGSRTAFAKSRPLHCISSRLQKTSAVGREEAGGRKEADAFQVLRERSELFGASSKAECSIYLAA